MKVSDYIADFLADQGCAHVFGYPGEAVTHLIDSFYQCKNLTFIGTYHEQAAAFAAEGYARMTNRPGVATATGGPGATNLITGIGSAYFDSIPCLYLTGQVNTAEDKGQLHVRQLGFQETDIVSIAKPITKYAVRITDAADIRYELEKAFYLMDEGRKGPVLLDIPMHIQKEDIYPLYLASYHAPPPAKKEEMPMKTVCRLLRESRRPVVLVGGGVRLSGASAKLNTICGQLRIPVVTSLMGRDAIDNDSPYYFGMIGTYGNRYANLVLANSDLILALGTRLDRHQTGTRPENFARGALLIRVDIDGQELARKIKADELAIQADAGTFLNALSKSLPKMAEETAQWLAKASAYKQRYPSRLSVAVPPVDSPQHSLPFGEMIIQSLTGPVQYDPNVIMEELSKLMGPEDAICLDVGQHQMWSAQSLHLIHGQRMLTSGGMGATGFALPCAIGAHYSGKGNTIFVLAGDGGMQMNIQELALIRRNHLPIKIIVLNNRSLGMIRHVQELHFDSRYFATVTDYDAPDFCRLASAYDIPSLQLDGSLFSQPKNERLILQEPFPGTKQSRADRSGPPLLTSLKERIARPGPLLIEIMLPPTTYVFPQLSLDRPIEDQEPFLSRQELETQMIIDLWDQKATVTINSTSGGKERDHLSIPD